MQKKIIALAVAGLVSGSAFAQSNVTISGLLDVGLLSTKAEAGAVQQSASKNAGYNNSATSNIAFRAQEDLGGGMRAGVFLETDIRGNNVAPTSTFADFQRYVFIGGGFGEVSLGQRTNFATTTAVTAQPFGTAMGGGYAGNFGRLRGASSNAYGAIAANGNVGTRDVRADGSIRYDSPNFNGLTLGLSHKFKNPSSGTETTPAAGHTNLGLNYNNGPLNVSYAFAKLTNVALIAAESNTKHNLLAANYKFGPATVYGGWSTSKGDTAGAGTDNVNSRAYNVGFKYDVTSNIALMANILRDNDKLATDVDRKLNALGADYAFSKRTAAYFRYESFDTDTKNAGGKNTNYAFGLRHSF